jgi:hypothetical protein
MRRPFLLLTQGQQSDGKAVAVIRIKLATDWRFNPSGRCPF